jgi:hypothetical protein
VLTLKAEQAPSNDDEPDTGTGASVEIESTKSKRGRSAMKKTVYEKKAKEKKNESGKTPTNRRKSSKQSKQSTTSRPGNNESGSGGRQIKAISDNRVGGKQAKAAAASYVKHAKTAPSSNEADAELQLDDVDTLSEEDIVQMLKDAEKEFESIRSLRLLQVGLLEGPPNVEKLISDANLLDLECLHRVANHDSLEKRLSIQMWWCIAKKACQIRGVFNLIRSQKSKMSTIQERYNAIVMEKLNGNGLHFAQASNYDRLGKFLSQFPLFLFQSKWVTLSDWFQKVGDSVLLDCIVSIAPLSSVFLRDAFTLHVDGFQLVDVRMNDCISNELIELCKLRVAASGEVVFNSSKNVQSRQNGTKRRQLPVDQIEGMLRFKTTLVDRLRALFPGHKVDSMVSLLSEEGCPSQLAHTDFTPDALQNAASDEKMPLACLVALTDGTAS